jgi:hypothetical protein
VGEVIFYAAPTVYQAVRKVFGGEVDELWDRVVNLRERVVEEAERAASGQ